MATFKIVDPIVGAPLPVTQTSTSQLFPLGVRVQAVDQNSGASALGAGFFQYCVGSSTASAVSSIGQFVQLQGNTAGLLLAAKSDSKFPIGVAAGALSNTNVYGWVQVHGLCDYARGTNSSIAAGADLYVCAGTGGLLVTNVVTGNRVANAVCPVSYTSSQSSALTIQLNFPTIAGLGDSRS